MDAAKVREDFPVLQRDLGNGPPIYFDNACQTLRPRQVLDAISEYYTLYSSCAGRSVHKLSTEVTLRCDEVRTKAAMFLGAESPSEIAFMKNTTEALNTVIMGIGLKKGDEVVTTDYEHNSVMVPVLRAVELTGARHKIVRSAKDGTFDLDAFEKAMSKKVKLVAMCMSSNVTGYTLPAREVSSVAHSYGAKVLFDAAQAVPSRKVDVRALNADYLAASAHKMLGPSGVGLFYCRSELSERLMPLILGGHGVSEVTYESYRLLPGPERFETGLQNYSGVFGTGAALDYLSRLGMDEVQAHENGLNKRMTKTLLDIPGVSLMEPHDPNLRGGMLSFNIKGLSAHDVAMILDNSRSIMMRSGMHCCHPYFRALGLDGSVRASVYVYNTEREVEVFSEAVRELASKFGGR